MSSSSSGRLSPGARIAPTSLQTLAHGSLAIPQAEGLLHLQFRRFAGCPICSLHLRSFARQLPRLDAAGIRTVAFFHSTAESLRPYHADLPMAVVPDPERRWYRRFGVEQSLLGMAHPRALWAGLVGTLRVPSDPLGDQSGRNGLPADFLLDAEGTVRAVHYGAHFDDSWEVDDVLAHAAALTSPVLAG